MAIWGADIAQLKTLGTKLQAGASEIEKQKSQPDQGCWTAPTGRARTRTSSAASGPART